MGPVGRQESRRTEGLDARVCECHVISIVTGI